MEAAFRNTYAETGVIYESIGGSVECWGCDADGVAVGRPGSS
jgi:hypothetical protein